MIDKEQKTNYSTNMKFIAKFKNKVLLQESANLQQRFQTNPKLINLQIAEDMSEILHKKTIHFKQLFGLILNMKDPFGPWIKKSMISSSLQPFK